MRLALTILLWQSLFVSNALAKVSYILHHKGNKIHVEAEFDSKIASIEGLDVPGLIWGTDYKLQLKNIDINGNKLSYDIGNVGADLFIDSYANKYYHYIDSTQFYLIGHGAFIIPKNLPDSCEIEIIFESKCKSIVTNLSADILPNGRMLTDRSDLEKVVILAAENIDIEYDNATRTKVILMSQDKVLAKRLSKIFFDILLKQKRFWGSKSDEHIFMAVTPPVPINRNSWGAYVIDNSIISFINPSLNADEDYKNLAGHEGMHFYFGSNLLRGPVWFTEGFCDYYRDKLLLYYSDKVGEFIEAYNKKIEVYIRHPLRGLPNNIIEKRFFQYSLVEKLPYIKGYLIAGQIDSVTNLDDLLKKMLKACREDRQYCHFSGNNIQRSLDEISADKMSKINAIINFFDANKLEDKFLGKFKRYYSNIYVKQYPKILSDIIALPNYRNFLGVNLVQLSDNFKEDEHYSFSNIKLLQNGKLEFLIFKDQMLQKLYYTPTKEISLQVPRYDDL